jgi:hypothetical protein
MKTFTVVRQDQRFHSPERPSVSIAREVFEARAGTEGWRWILDPPLEVRRGFWELYGPSIERGHEVFVAEGRVLLEEVRDVHERALPGLGDRKGEGALFFVDLDPDANWSHPCAYILMPANGEPVRLAHDWPPSESVRLVPLPRPSGP